jgi:hypothetical protein
MLAQTATAEYIIQIAFTQFHCFKCPSQNYMFEGQTISHYHTSCMVRVDCTCKQVASLLWHSSTVNFKLFIVFHKFVISATFMLCVQ